jgi:hypothetical protein
MTVGYRALTVLQIVVIHPACMFTECDLTVTWCGCLRSSLTNGVPEFFMGRRIIDIPLQRFSSSLEHPIEDVLEVGEEH